MASTPLSRLSRRTHEDDDGATGRSPWRRPGFVVSAVVLALLALLAVVLFVLPPSDDYTPPPPPPPPPPRPGFVVSAVVLALLALLAVVLFVLPPSDEDTAAPQPSPQPSPSASTEPEGDGEPVAGESVCGLAPGSPGIPVEAPTAQWQLVGTTAVPTDPDGAGPGVTTDDGFASCFSHDPTGALFAGINWWAQGFNGRSVEVYEELTAESPERDAALEQGLTDNVQGFGQIAGYRFIESEEDRVVYELAVRTPNGSLASLPTAMRWEDGDWKFVIPSTGNPGIGALTDLAGFTPWSGLS
ncbi:hypothetical protein WDV85_16715 [Pseudokineococcus sp. 5B2Z-1]|uniref:hypothetical protein n=1 Tax=Pseudokineococcus sp. 5B2Z-1 TaxID=3132744 RepID=UPI0030B03437